jgi:hypothetical protein
MFPTPEELVRAIEDSGGTLIVQDPSIPVRAAYRRALHSLLNDGTLRPELRLTYSGRDHGDLMIKIEPVAREHDEPQELLPIVVPADLRRCSPVITATRDVARKDKSGWISTRRQEGVAHIQVHADALHRSLLILQALINEGERRGYRAVVGEHCKGLCLTISGHNVELVLTEESKRIPHELTSAETKQRERGYGYGYGIPDWDYLPTGRLVLRNDHGGYGSTIMAADRQRWALDDKLPLALSKMEEKAAAAEQRRLRTLAEAEERRKQWEAAMAQAKEDYAEVWRAEELKRMVERWRFVRDAREVIGLAKGRPDLTEADRDWLAWAESFVTTRLDPTLTPLAPGEAPEPKPEELKPFLGRWNPHGPDGW